LFVGLFGGVLSLKGVSGIIYLSLFCQKKRDRCRADNLQSCYHENQISQILQKYFKSLQKSGIFVLINGRCRTFYVLKGF
jgi:hypothetical protein